MTQEKFDQGLEIRRTVLGDEYVNRSLAAATPFNKPLQELVTEYCWGAVWGREGLPLKTRSMLNVGILVALNRSTELKLHLEGALNNGCTPEEISEILLQTAAYCGFPAAIEGFRVAKSVLEDRGLS